MSIQQAGDRTSTNIINDVIQIGLDNTKYNISSRLNIKDIYSEITINNQKISNEKILIVIVGIYRDGINFNNFEPDGANYPEYIEPKHIYDDDNTSLYTYGSASVTNANRTYTTEENGVIVEYKAYLTLVEMTLNSTPTGKFLYMVDFTYKGSRDYVNDVFIVTKNDNYVQNSPYMYNNEATPDLVSFISEFLDEERLNRDDRCIIDEYNKTYTEVYIEPSSIPLDRLNLFDDNLILNFSSTESSLYLKIFSNDMTVQLATDNNRVNDTRVNFSALLSPYKNEGVNYFYEATLSRRNIGINDTYSLITFYDSSKNQIKVSRLLFTHNSNYGHLNMFTQKPKHNYPSSYSTSNPITQRMLNDMIFTANRNFYKKEAQNYLSSYIPSIILGTTSQLTKSKFLFYLYDSKSSTPLINLTDFKIDFLIN